MLFYMHGFNFMIFKVFLFLEVISFFARFQIMQSSINSLLFLHLPNLFLKLKCTHRARTFLHKNTLLFYTLLIRHAWLKLNHLFKCTLHFFNLNALIVHATFVLRSCYFSTSINCQKNLLFFWHSRFQLYDFSSVLHLSSIYINSSCNNVHVSFLSTVRDFSTVCHKIYHSCTVKTVFLSK